MAEVTLSSFNLEYCKLFSADQLRKMYNGEPKEVLDALIEKLGLSVEPEPKPEPIPEPEVPAKDESPEAAKEAEPEAEVLPEKEPDAKNSSKK